MNKKNLSALIGLCGAVGNNGKTENTDAIVREALFCAEDFDLRSKIQQEKFEISPNCATCTFPCGNTSDFPMEAFDLWDENQCLLKEEIYKEILRIMKTVQPDGVLPDVIYKAISYIGYDLSESSHRKLLEELNLW